MQDGTVGCGAWSCESGWEEPGLCNNERCKFLVGNKMIEWYWALNERWIEGQVAGEADDC